MFQKTLLWTGENTTGGWGRDNTDWRVFSRVAAGEQAGGEVDAEEGPGKAKMLESREKEARESVRLGRNEETR